MTSYCETAPGHQVHAPYHDSEYGFPVDDESVLFERLTLEIFQAGLSWLIILKKRPAFALAFENFKVDRVAAFDAADIERLVNDPLIIRNRRKIEATIHNAKVVQELRIAMEGSANGSKRTIPCRAWNGVSCSARPSHSWVRKWSENS